LKIFRIVWLLFWVLAGGIIAGTVLPLAWEGAYRLLAGAANRTEDAPAFRQPLTLGGTYLFGCIVFGLLGAYALARIEDAAYRWESMGSGEKVTLFVALLIGVLFSIPFHMLAFSFGVGAIAGSFALMIALVWLSIAALKGMHDAMPWSAGAIRKTDIKVFDTNVIIDGRVYEVCKAGFLEGKFYVPQFVLSELQLIADSHDPNRRQRGRRGLDMLKHLQASFEVDIGSQDRMAGEPSDKVDDKLIRLARALGASLVTNDFNLNKVAQVQGIPVMNINDLAMAMRPVFLPGDTLEVQIEKPGSQNGQGIGYLEDGTMVVIEGGEPHIGERLETQVTQIHQSAAGRMIFATVDPNGGKGRRLR
jgi:uncharacterized protein YacL